MRLYTFCNYYLSSIQQGIQSAHLIAELFVKYRHYSDPRVHYMLYEWATHHKTMVVLNGGNSQEIEEFSRKAGELAGVLNYPYNWFFEDNNSLNGALTNFGVVIPEQIYGYNEFERKRTPNPVCDVYVLNPYQLTNDEKEFAKLIAPFPLAR